MFIFVILTEACWLCMITTDSVRNYISIIVTSMYIILFLSSFPTVRQVVSSF